MNKYFTILTSVGEAKLANATALGETVKLTELALGDGDGALPTPKQSQTALVNEVRRKALNSVAVDENNPSWVMCEQVIPEDVGGWTIREVGIYDEDGDLIAVGNFPETYKPVLEEGSGRTQTIRVVLQISSTSTVELKIDPSVVLATREYVDKQDVEHVNADNPHPQYATDKDLSDLVALSQGLPYDKERTYKAGDICYTRATSGEVSYWQWYSNVESLAGKSPLDETNRPSGWQDDTKPCFWIEYHGNVPGQFAFWPSDDVPENAIKIVDADIDATLFWRIAEKHPSLVSNGKINLVSIAGRYIRAAKGSSYEVGTIHGDAIRDIFARFTTNNGWMFTTTSGAMGLTGGLQSYANATSTSGSSPVAPAVDFYASRVVPTAAQNQPVTAILNPIIFM